MNIDVRTLMGEVIDGEEAKELNLENLLDGLLEALKEEKI